MTTAITITYQDGVKPRTCCFEVPSTSRPDFSSCYVFAFHKSGSVLLNNVVTALMGQFGIPVVDLPAYCFANGISWDAIIADYSEVFKPNGYCYLGFRKISTGMRGIVGQLPGKKILMVRDPRDMLVSLYHSLKFSHPLPRDGTAQFYSEVRPLLDATETSIDEFCMQNVGFYFNAFNDYHELIDNASVRILRYEDVVFEKAHLAHTLRDWFSLDISTAKLSEIVAPFDVVPKGDQPTEHIRQVTPGDHKRKLQPATIEILNATLANFVRRFNYSL